LDVLPLQAKQAHNVSANACCAQLLEAAGQPDLAMPCWQRCAKAGHLEGQLRYGLALYRGMCGVVQDAEAAFMYLSRAVKQVQGNSSSSSSSSSTDGGNSSRVREAEAAAPPAPVPASSSSMVSSPGAAAAAPPGVQQTGLAAEVLRQAGVVLGYLHFDGEGTRSDRQEATRLFKMASDYGSKEAQQVLGWIFNTGQYG
jgi:TPR repeat protein